MKNTSNQAALTGIAIRKRPKTAMVQLSEAPVSCAHGVASDFRGKPGKRQVTVLSEQSWQQACQQLNSELHWLTRRANLLVSGLEFSAADVGKVLHIGSLQLRICRQTNPCHWMDKAYSGLQAALAPNWRGGVCCQVINDAQIKIGDEAWLGP
ncbi:MAG: MOSC domain-containing protein YiiM [Oceanicoccus sp.]|jgi:MOSC domain-containing protein YiiM